jgi:hypothetical protein
MVAPPPPPNFDRNSRRNSVRQRLARNSSLAKSAPRGSFQRLTPRQELQIKRLQRFIEPPAEAPIEIEVEAKREFRSQSFPPWFPFLLATLVFGLGISTIAAGTLAYYALRDPSFVRIEQTEKKIEFSRWTLVAIAVSCTVGSILMARLHEK